MIKIWVDDMRVAPSPDYFSFKSVNDTIHFVDKIRKWKNFSSFDILLDLDHDAGDYSWDGGDYIEILNWFEAEGLDCYLHIHSMNPVGRQNMEAVAIHNNWCIC